MNLKKKLLALGLSLALALSLTACGRNPEEPAQTEEPAQSEALAEVPHHRLSVSPFPAAS